MSPQIFKEDIFMRTFQVSTNPYGDGRLYTRKDVSFEPGKLTCLVGCNGSGKSTLMMLLKDKLKKEKDILILDYDDRKNGGHNLMEKMAFFGDIEGVASMFVSSEGERIYQGVGQFIGTMRRQILKKNPKEIWIFLDAVGSGMSIDKIQDIKLTVPIIVDDNSDKDVYFIVSTNEYEFASGSDCIDVTTFQHVKFINYPDYRTYVMKTAEKKAKRYERISKELREADI